MYFIKDKFSFKSGFGIGKRKKSKKFPQSNPPLKGGIKGGCNMNVNCV